MKNRFAIITPSYNNEDWVETYFDSIDCQTYKNYRIIYINDNSTDRTEELVLQRRLRNSENFTYIKSANRGAGENYKMGIGLCDDDDIILNVDGDDWLATPDVLMQLNDVYTKYDYWMTYGKMFAYSTDEASDNPIISEANPQNTPYDPFIHKYQLYRRDVWRASHLRTYRKFLFDKIDQKDFISRFDGKMFWHAHDLALMYPMLEMTPIEKIGVIQFPTYMYNASKTNALRTKEREQTDNSRFETEIRTKKTYKRSSDRSTLTGEKLPQVNFISDIKERNSIPTKFSIVYNQIDGEFDITLVQDDSILKVISGDIKVNKRNGKLVADVHEPPYLFTQSEVYQKVYQNSTMFDVILTNNEQLLTLPNAVFRNSGYEVVLNKNVHKSTWPILQDNSLIKLYDKSKLVSFITSNKTFTKGHEFRMNCFNYLCVNKAKVDMFGVGIREIVGKIEALKDYRFSIAIENGQCKNYFTEKILDCFLTGTIPIYHGCPNIGDFFNTDGFFIFNTEEELLKILISLTEKDYSDRMAMIKENFEKADAWWYDNDRFFEKYLKKLI